VWHFECFPCPCHNKGNELVDIPTSFRPCDPFRPLVELLVGLRAVHINRDPHLLRHCQDTRERPSLPPPWLWPLGCVALEFGGPPWIWPGLDGWDGSDGWDGLARLDSDSGGKWHDYD